MKEVKLTKTERLESKALLVQVLKVPSRGMDLEEMRRRVRVLSKLDEATGSSILLEDADFEIVVQALRNHTWPIADAEILSTVDAVLASKEPEKKADKKAAA